MTSPPAPRSSAPPPAEPANPPPPLSAGPLSASQAPVPSESLLRGRSMVEICHNGATYRLQATRQGKLILTK